MYNKSSSCKMDNHQRKKNYSCTQLPYIMDYGPDPFIVNLGRVAKGNDYFRSTLWSGNDMQLTLMSLKPGEDIGLEMHPNLEQFIYVESGMGFVRMGSTEEVLDYRAPVYDNYAFIIPQGTWHNLFNIGREPLKLYSLYSPPQHPHGTVHETKEIAEADEHH